MRRSSRNFAFWDPFRTWLLPDIGADICYITNSISPSSAKRALLGLPAAISKTVADCEVLYIPVFWARAKMAEGFLL
jgi:hypothetical protein